MKIELEFLANNYIRIKYTDIKSNYNKYINIIMKYFIKDIVCYDDGWIMYHNVINRLKQYFSINYLNEYTPPEYMAMGEDMKLQPYEYQKEAIYYNCCNQKDLLVLPCGAGKTVIGIGTYLEAKKQGLITTPGLIIVKASLKIQWQKEVSKFSDLTSNIIQTYAVRCKKLSNKDIDENKIDEYFLEQFNGYDLLICNYETLLDQKVLDALIDYKIDYIFCDEIQLIKNHKSKRAKALYNLNNAKFTIGATATPITKDPRDVYGIYKFICPDIFGKVGEFQKRYINFAGYGRINGFKNQEELRDKIKDNIFIKTKQEVAKQLPELAVNKIYIDPISEQLALHQQLMDQLDELQKQDFQIRQKCHSEFEANTNADLQKLNGQIMALQTFAQELADSSILLQTSESDFSKQFGNMIESNENPKLNMCLELIDQIIESGEKVCIFSKFERMQNILTEAIKNYYKNKNPLIAYINGSLNAEQRYVEAYDKFRDNDEYKILLSSDAGAEGLNLSSCKYLIEYDLATSYAVQTQRQGRLERADSIHQNVICYQLIMNGLWDEIQEKIISKKQGYDENIIKSLKQ